MGSDLCAMIEIGPVRMIALDPIYEVLPADVEMLSERGFTYEVVQLRPAWVRQVHGLAAP